MTDTTMTEAFATNTTAANSNSDDVHLQSIRYSVIRFDYHRPPGFPASGIALGALDATGDWDQHLLFTCASGPARKIRVDCFKLAWGPEEEQCEMRRALEKHAMYLVFQSGQRAVIDLDGVGKMQRWLREWKMLWDEWAVVEEMNAHPEKAHLFFPDMFGTWADVVLFKLCEKSEETLAWKKVGRDPRLMPREDKLLELESDEDEQDDGDEVVVDCSD